MSNVLHHGHPRRLEFGVRMLEFEPDKCSGGMDFAFEVLNLMRMDVPQSIEWLYEQGNCCDCDIVSNLAANRL